MVQRIGFWIHGLILLKSMAFFRCLEMGAQSMYKSIRQLLWTSIFFFLFLPKWIVLLLVLTSFSFEIHFFYLTNAIIAGSNLFMLLMLVWNIWIDYMWLVFVGLRKCLEEGENQVRVCFWLNFFLYFISDFGFGGLLYVLRMWKKWRIKVKC